MEPRRLAELAGTSRRGVRHYHDLGLLPEPERWSNGYQQHLELLPPYRSHAAVVASDNLPGDADESSREVVATGIADHLRRLTAAR